VNRHPLLAAAALLLTLPSCMKDMPFKLEYAGYAPLELGDGWVVSDPVRENIDPTRLTSVFRTVYRDDRFMMIRSLIVVRNGRIVAEAYPRSEEDIDQIQNIKSVTKSLTSILTGIAFQHGLLDSLSQTFSSIYPEYFTDRPDKAGITIEQALTMRTGLQLHGGDHSYQLYHSADPIAYILDFPLESAPGTEFWYTDDNPMLVSYAIQRRCGQPLAEFAREYLFEPLGITDWKWEAAGQEVNFGGSNSYLKPRDLAKIGQMLLQNGVWDGQPVVDPDWLAAATGPHVPMNDWAYGYYFWENLVDGFFWAAGHGGQTILIAPGKNLVVVVTAWPYVQDSPEFRDNIEFGLINQLLDGCH
jgi:CubicO group peptidase (beta-lactamase class C family)